MTVAVTVFFPITANRNADNNCVLKTDYHYYFIHQVTCSYAVFLTTVTARITNCIVMIAVTVIT